jgi:pimeloyl-ACP methyl ester carboxylesterase
VETHVIPDAGHDLTVVRADLVNETVLDFLGRP